MSDKKVCSTPTVVGLTGGVGSGKTTVASIFSELAVPVLDLDKVGHAVIAEDVDVQAQLIHAFGSEIQKNDGTIDRRMLAEKTFASEEATAVINAIEHPAIWARQASWLTRQTTPYVLIEASVLIESGGAGRMDAVIIVLADEKVRRRRVLARSGFIDGAMFESIIARQCDDDVRLSYADYVIQNNGDINELDMQVKVLHEKLKLKFAG